MPLRIICRYLVLHMRLAFVFCDVTLEEVKWAVLGERTAQIATDKHKVKGNLEFVSLSMDQYRLLKKVGIIYLTFRMQIGNILSQGGPNPSTRAACGPQNNFS